MERLSADVKRKQVFVFIIQLRFFLKFFVKVQEELKIASRL